MGTRKPRGPLGLLAQAKGQQVGWGWKLYGVALSSTLRGLLSLWQLQGVLVIQAQGSHRPTLVAIYTKKVATFIVIVLCSLKSFYFGLFWTQSHYRPLASLKLLNPGWTKTCGDPPTSAYRVLGPQICATLPG